MFPKQIPIKRKEKFYTHHVGAYAGGGQFMGFVVADIAESAGGSWQEQKRWYSVLYKFDDAGALVEHLAEFHGTSAEGEDEVVARALERLEQWLAELEGLRYCSVNIQLFRVEIDGRRFGLLTAEEVGYFDPDEDDDELRWRVHLWPNDLVFYPPWTGEYDT